jgi:hypothetical protein
MYSLRVSTPPPPRNISGCASGLDGNASEFYLAGALFQSRRRHNPEVSPGISRFLQEIIEILLQIRPRLFLLHPAKFILHCHHTIWILFYLTTLIHRSLRPFRMTTGSAADKREVARRVAVHWTGSGQSPLLGCCKHVKEPSVHIRGEELLE